MAKEKTEGLPKGICWREDKNCYLGRVTYQGKMHYLYDDSWKRLEKRLQTLREELKQGMHEEECNMTLNAWFDEWMEVYKKASLKYGTYQNYEKHYDYYIRSDIGKKKIREVTADDIQKLFNGLAERDFALGTIKLVSAVLNGCFKKAVNKHLVKYNPLPMAELPVCKEKLEKYVFTKKEQDAFLEESAKSYLFDFFRCVLMTGMRNGEARGLRWCDIDFEQNRILIRHTLVWVEGEGWRLDTPKTKSSKREIPMLPKVYEILHGRKEEAESIGNGGDENYEFISPSSVEWVMTA